MPPAFDDLGHAANFYHALDERRFLYFPSFATPSAVTAFATPSAVTAFATPSAVTWRATRPPAVYQLFTSPSAAQITRAATSTELKVEAFFARGRPLSRFPLRATQGTYYSWR